MKRLLQTACLFSFCLGLASLAANAEPRRAIVFGVDGLSPDGLMHAETPNFHKLMRSGASTLKARAVMPTSSSPNWASMLMGAGPEQHGVTSNEWETNKFDFPPTVLGPGNMFPTLFSVLRAQHPQAVMGAFYDWGGFGRLYERALVDVSEHCEGPTNTIERTVAFLKERKPDFVFIQLDHVDHAGHAFGHGTSQYYASVEVADKLLGRLLEGIDAAGLGDSTAVLVTADHGGVGKGHGGNSMAELEIPWILAGPGIVHGKPIAAPVNTFDTAATLARYFEVQPPDCWIARPVVEAFEPNGK